MTRSVLLLLALCVSTFAQEPKPQSAPSAPPADILLSKEENGQLDAIFLAIQANGSQGEFVAAIATDALAAFDRADGDKKLLAAARHLKLARGQLTALEKESAALNQRYQDWLAKLKETHKCLDCQPDFRNPQSRRLVRPQPDKK